MSMQRLAHYYSKSSDARCKMQHTNALICGLTLTHKGANTHDMHTTHLVHRASFL